MFPFLHVLLLVTYALTGFDRWGWIEEALAKILNELIQFALVGIMSTRQIEEAF